MLKQPCPKAGYIHLVHSSGESITMRTECHTWECPTCSKKLISLVKMKIAYGVLTLGQSCLITVTFVAGSQRWKDARSVAAAFKELRRLWREQLGELEWFRMVELTKKGMPHLHLIVSGEGLKGRRPNCMEWPTYDARWRVRNCSCLTHYISGLWHRVTKDSYVVDVRFVLGAFGAAAYLAKYLVKGMGDREELKEMGFHRRYSRSGGWPGSRLRLRATTRGGWISISHHGREESSIGEPLVREGEGHWLSERSGTDLSKELGARSARRAGLRRLGVINESIQAANVSDFDNGGS